LLNSRRGAVDFERIDDAEKVGRNIQQINYPIDYTLNIG
jgi:hypothetical protein